MMIQTTLLYQSWINVIIYFGAHTSSLIKPLNPHDALKHHFESLKNDLISWNLGVLKRKILWNCLKITVYVFICHQLQVIFIHFKSRIATAIRGL